MSLKHWFRPWWARSHSPSPKRSGRTRPKARHSLLPRLEELESRLVPTSILPLAAFSMGPQPQAGLVEDSQGNLFGTTRYGGSSADGTVFEVAAGSGILTTLASFTGTNGANPQGGLIMDSQGNLFGTTSQGGSSYNGTVFEIAKGSGTITTLASFNFVNGSNPLGCLVVDSSGNLFGTTSYGGTSYDGTVFEVVKGSGTITTLASFNGANSTGGLVEDQSGNLFGTTSYGGTDEDGTVFEVAKGSGTITTLASFNGDNGSSPTDSLVVDSSGDLFGTTSSDDISGNGTVFEVINGSQSITTLASFTGDNGYSPNGGLVMDSQGDLFGTTSQGGSSNDGTVFEVAQGSGTITTLASFTGDNGANPQGGLVEDSSGNLFGTTLENGPLGAGTVFGVNASGTISTLASFSGNTGANPKGGLVEDQSGNLFGTTTYGGADWDGTVYEVASGSGTITTLASFNGDNGANPIGTLVEDSSGNLFGTTQSGGSSDDGTVFEVAAGSGTITTLASFTGDNGANPIGGLVEDSNGDLFGTTSSDDISGNGTVFEVINGSQSITTLAFFNGDNGSSPSGSLVMDSSGDLFGTTPSDDISGNGTVFEVINGSQSITTLAFFNGDNGSSPSGSLVMDSSGDLFGTTSSDDISGNGTVFEVINGSQSITTLASFNGDNGSSPNGGLVMDSKGNLFGTTSQGGSFYDGTVFEVAQGSETITTLASFNSTNGDNPLAGLLEDSSGNFFGTTQYGGSSSDGAVFEVPAPGVPVVSSISPSAGLTSGGTSVVITGTSFTGATAVTFGNLAAASFTVNSDTQITAVAPVEAAGTVNITVTTVAGTSATSAQDQFTFVVPPTVSSISPTSGPIKGGTVVTITGSNFTAASAVKFGSTAATSVTVDSSTQITATAPAGEVGMVNITVSTSGVVSSATASDQFTYLGPLVNLVYPSSGPPTGGTVVTLTGYNFTGATAVMFGKTAATSFTVNSDNQITATAPAETGGLVTIKVTTADGTSGLTGSYDQFTFVMASAVETLVSFSNVPNPSGGLVQDSQGNLFGVTSQGGSSGKGTVFEVASGSSTITTLASFTGAKGADPSAGLVVDSHGNLFGTTSSGGTYGEGTVFEVASGSGTITTLASFNGNDGANPFGTLAEDHSGNLFGITSAGGPFGHGTVFEVAQGSGTITTLTFFTASSELPNGGLVVDSGDNLFGITSAGGPSSDGTVFEIAKGSGTMTILASFTGANGAGPYGSLVEDSNGNFFGTTESGGTSNDGTVFELAAGSTTITTLASFPSGEEVYIPTNSYSLVLDGSGNLFGTTSYGGTSYDGTAFEVVKGSGTITTLASFTGGAQGSYPTGNPVVDSNGNLFGTTSNGGASGAGIVFEVAQGSGTITTLASFPGSSGSNSFGGLVEDSNGNLFGTTENGGKSDDGTVFEWNHQTAIMTTLATFTGANGSFPQGGLVEDSNGNLFGLTESGGSSGQGTVFELAAGSTTITTLASFTATDTSGAYPTGGLVEDSGGNLFGTTQSGGSSEQGTVFEVVKGSGTITTLASFTGTGYAEPNGRLIEDSSGDLFGTTLTGGPDGDGTVFEVASGSGTVTTLASFTGANGSYPYGGLVEDSGGNLFGTTQSGGSSKDGTVFEVASGSETITTLASFNGTNGSDPTGNLVVDSKGNLFGTSSAGPYEDGTVFEVAKGSGTISTLATFNGTNGDIPQGGLIEDQSGNLFGTTSYGGTNGGGTVFEVPATSLTPPVVSSISPATGPIKGGTVVTITGSDFIGATAVTFGTTAVTNFKVQSATQMTATAPPGAVGTVDITITTANGTSPATTNDQFTYVGPLVTSISPSTGPIKGGTVVTITGSDFTGTTAVTFGSTAATSFIVNSDTQITATAPAGMVGPVDIKVTTAAGTSAATANDQFTYMGPQVTVVSPFAGSGGTVVTITGSGFTSATAVKFGSTTAVHFTVNSDTQISVTAPAHAAGSVDITVTTPNGTSALSTADKFTYESASTVTAIKPSAGPTLGGTSVILSGTNFIGASAVNFGTTPAASFLVNSATQITAVAPAESVGQVDITVTTPSGTSATSSVDRFTFVTPPAVSGISPATGPMKGGTVVTITGTNFTGASAVKFGTTAAVSFTVNSDTQITATAPAGAVGSVDVTVTTAGGTTAVTSADQFTYVGPVVTSISPTAGPLKAGTVVTITGTTFTGATAVMFGTKTASSFTVKSAMQITATAPAGAVGSVNITVTTANGTSTTSAADQFTYVAAPVLSSISPNAGPLGGERWSPSPAPTSRGPAL